MPYSPMTSYNYTPMSLQQISGAGGQAATQGLDFARWLAGQGLDLANLVRADRNTQLAVENAYRQQQANRAYEAQRLAQDAALRQENWSRSLQNPLVGGAIQKNVEEAFSSPSFLAMQADWERRNPMRYDPYGRKIGGYTTVRTVSGAKK